MAKTDVKHGSLEGKKMEEMLQQGNVKSGDPIGDRRRDLFLKLLLVSLLFAW